ncbi:MAG: ABC transporter ATP-binding protein [bacterium]
MEKSAPNSTKLAWKAFKTVLSVDTKIGFPYLIAKNASALLNLYLVFIFGKLIDSIGQLIVNYESFSISALSETGALKYFFILVISKLFIIASAKTIEYADIALYNLFWTKTIKNIMTKISSLNLEDVENQKIQKLVTTVPSYSVDSVWNTFTYLTEMVNNILVLIGAGWVITTQMSPWGLLVIFFVIPEAIYKYKQNRKLKEFRDQNATRLQYTDYLYQQSVILNNFPELRVDSVFDFLIDSYENSSKIFNQSQNNIRLKREKGTALLSFVDEFFLRVVQLLLIPVSIARKYTIGQFKYLFDYLDNLFTASWNVIWMTFLIKENSFYIDDYFQLIEYKGFGDIVSGTQKIDSIQVPSIEFINVDFSYPDSSSSTLENVSFRIDPGEKVAILGPDNSGKSTIAKLLCGLYRIGPGDILIDNISIRNLERGQLKDKIAVVFEHYIKYEFSIRKNITLTETETEFRRRKFEESLEITDLDKWMRENDFDESQILGKQIGQGIQISSGHWQRIAISRSLYRDRHILILDESLTQIDGPSRETILKNIMEYRPKQTLIYITQDNENLSLFNKIIHIDKGKITEIQKR